MRTLLPWPLCVDNALSVGRVPPATPPPQYEVSRGGGSRVRLGVCLRSERYYLAAVHYTHTKRTNLCRLEARAREGHARDHRATLPRRLCRAY